MARTMDINKAIAENERLISVAPTMSEAKRLRKLRDVLDIIKMSLEKNPGSSFVTLDDEGSSITYTIKKEATMERRVFTYKDVEEARKYIGKTGYFSDYFRNIEMEPRLRADLGRVTKDGHFIDEVGGCWEHFSPDPEPVEKWVPFNAEDWALFIGKPIRYKNDPGAGCRIITSAGKLDVFANQWKQYNELLDKWEFMDGTPCGKKVVE